MLGSLELSSTPLMYPYHHPSNQKAQSNSRYPTERSLSSHTDSYLGKLGKSKLISQRQRQLRMLKHMREAQVLNLILGSMDLLITELEVALNDESRGITSLASTGVVRASITALSENIGNVAVVGDDGLDKLSQAGVNVVSNDTDGLRLASSQSSMYVAGHVLLQHSLDITACLLVVLEDSLRAQKTTLLGAVPVELDGVLGLALHNVFGGQ